MLLKDLPQKANNYNNAEFQYFAPYEVRMNVTLRSSKLKVAGQRVALLTERTWKLGPWRWHCCFLFHVASRLFWVQIQHTSCAAYTSHAGIHSFNYHCTWSFWALSITCQFDYQEKCRFMILHFVFCWSVSLTHKFPWISGVQPSNWTSLYVMLCSTHVQLPILHFSSRTSREK